METDMIVVGCACAGCVTSHVTISFYRIQDNLIKITPVMVFDDSDDVGPYRVTYETPEYLLRSLGEQNVRGNVEFGVGDCNIDLSPRDWVRLYRFFSSSLSQ